MEDCIFCSIVSGDIPGRVVYEDEATLAFLDANPLAEGHTLVVPKEHHERVNDLPADVAGAIGETIATVGPAAEAAVDAPASTIAYNNGEAAGQEIPHVHAHIVPRSPDDGGRPIHSLFGARPEFSDEELDDVVDRIAERA
ncbi:MAG: HIT family protein [Halobacteriales archaeon]